MTQVVIYIKDWCGYCRAAMELLDHLDMPYEKIDVTHDLSLYDVMLEKAQGRTSVPQIFIDGKGVGGYTELYQMVHSKP